MQSMEEKNGERRENDRSKVQQHRDHAHSSSSNYPNDNSPINKTNQPSATVSTIEDQGDYQLSTQRLAVPMKSSISSHYILNNIPPNEEEKSTYSFRHVTKKLQHAKSHGELYQPQAPLPLPPMMNIDQDENAMESIEKHSSDANRSFSLTKTSMTPVPILTSPTRNSSTSSEKVPFWKRFKQILSPNKPSKDQENPSSTNRLPTNEPNGRVRSSAPNIDIHVLQNPIKLSELKTWLISKPFPEQCIRDEYEKLPTESLHPKTLAFRPENKSKNRFNSIEPYDHSRVILRPLITDPSSDYINASYIDGYRAKKQYIAAQAPTDTTLYDFIRMIWQLRIQSIITVTRLFEDGKHKCVQYWPDEGEKRINDFRIHTESEENYADYTIRKFIIYNQSETSEGLSVNQYHFLSWRDHGCLSLSTPLLDFRRRLRADYKLSSNPILVHCSAGVGRSGTFIALDALLETAEHRDTIDVLDFTHRMRQNRVHMIQTADQYVYLYQTLVEGLLTMDTNMPLQEYLLKERLPMDPKSQYKLLEQLQSTIEYSYRSALDPANINKNRVETILAPDYNRPYLMTQVDKTTDYINAVFINSYRRTSAYIITQYPLTRTYVDFWRLVFDHNVSIIMFLESVPRDARSNNYWSDTIGQAVYHGPFEIIMTSLKEDEELIDRVFQIKLINKNLANNDRIKTIHHYQVKNYAYILSIVKRFLKQTKASSEQNVILQCLNGARWSGYFAALCNSIDQMQTEQIIDVFTVVRLLRAIRPQLIEQDQYENLFLLLRDYAQRYPSTISSQRTRENPSHLIGSGQDPQSNSDRMVQRL